jgi:hypothetical protein
MGGWSSDLTDLIVQLHSTAASQYSILVTSFWNDTDYMDLTKVRRTYWGLYLTMRINLVFFDYLRDFRKYVYKDSSYEKINSVRDDAYVR